MLIDVEIVSQRNRNWDQSPGSRSSPRKAPARRVRGGWAPCTRRDRSCADSFRWPSAAGEWVPRTDTLRCSRVCRCIASRRRGSERRRRARRPCISVGRFRHARRTPASRQASGVVRYSQAVGRAATQTSRARAIRSATSRPVTDRAVTNRAAKRRASAGPAGLRCPRRPRVASGPKRTQRRQ